MFCGDVKLIKLILERQLYEPVEFTVSHWYSNEISKFLW